MVVAFVSLDHMCLKMVAENEWKHLYSKVNIMLVHKSSE